MASLFVVSARLPGDPQQLTGNDFGTTVLRSQGNADLPAVVADDHRVKGSAPFGDVLDLGDPAFNRRAAPGNELAHRNHRR